MSINYYRKPDSYWRFMGYDCKIEYDSYEDVIYSNCYVRINGDWQRIPVSNYANGLDVNEWIVENLPLTSDE